MAIFLLAYSFIGRKKNYQRDQNTFFTSLTNLSLQSYFCRLSFKKRQKTKKQNKTKAKQKQNLKTQVSLTRKQHQTSYQKTTKITNLSQETTNINTSKKKKKNKQTIKTYEKCLRCCQNQWQRHIEGRGFELRY